MAAKLANRQATGLKRKIALPSASDHELLFPATKGKYKAKVIEYMVDEEEEEEEEPQLHTDPRRSIDSTDSTVCTLLLFFYL